MTALTLQESYIILIAHFVALMMFTLPLTLHVTIDLPPPKRRKTLAGSIVSTALSAALIGTAVGLTVYRLWKGKGRQTEVPPPPYEEGGWIPSPSVGHDQKSEETSGPHYVPVPQPDPCEYPESSVSSSAHRRRQRHVAGRRTLPRQRKVHSRAGQIYAHTFNFSPSHPSTHSPIPAEFNFGSPSPGPEEMVEAEDADEMDWIGDSSPSSSKKASVPWAKRLSSPPRLRKTKKTTAPASGSRKTVPSLRPPPPPSARAVGVVRLTSQLHRLRRNTSRPSIRQEPRTGIVLTPFRGQAPPSARPIIAPVLAASTRRARSSTARITKTSQHGKVQRSARQWNVLVNRSFSADRWPHDNSRPGFVRISIMTRTTP